jgi:hypothetical protein
MPDVGLERNSNSRRRNRSSPICRVLALGTLSQRAAYPKNMIALKRKNHLQNVPPSNANANEPEIRPNATLRSADSRIRKCDSNWFTRPTRRSYALCQQYAYFARSIATALLTSWTTPCRSERVEVQSHCNNHGTAAKTNALAISGTSVIAFQISKSINAASLRLAAMPRTDQ